MFLENVHNVKVGLGTEHIAENERETKIEVKFVFEKVQNSTNWNKNTSVYAWIWDHRSRPGRCLWF